MAGALRGRDGERLTLHLPDFTLGEIRGGIEQVLAVGSDRSEYLCDVCDKVFGSNHRLREHINSKHVNGDTDSTMPAKVNQTMKEHRGEPMFAEILKTENIIESREREIIEQFDKHEADAVESSDEKKPEFQKEQIPAHEEMNNGKPSIFFCRKCDKTFTRKDALFEHKTNQHNNLHCPEVECRGKKFARNDQLKRHTEVQHSQPAECDRCKETFDTRSRMKLHKKSCSFTCPSCPFHSLVLVNVQRHAATHIVSM
jgi:hypothetical protein